MRDADIVIIGGGPAGTSTAIIAAQLGCRVLLLEADVFPRHHVGESLVDLWEQFDALGVAEEMDETFLHKHGATRLWGRDDAPYSLEFTYLPEPRTYSLQVERSLFDLILLRRAEAVGAAVHQGHRVLEVLWEGERAVGARYETPEGRQEEARARVVIDASGRHGTIARRRALREIDPFYPDFSVYGYFRDCARPSGRHGGDLVVEAVPWGWLWFIPLHTGDVSVGLVCDRTTRSVLQARGIRAYFREALAQSRLVRERLAPATLVRGPIGTACHGYRSTCYAGPGWMLVGDAAVFLDPMWALGIANALQTGRLAGTMAEAVVRGTVDEEMVSAEYDLQVRRMATSYHDAVKVVYGGNRVHADGPFWQERRRRLADTSIPMDSLRWLTTNRAAPYFVRAIERLDVPQTVLDLFEAAKNRANPQMGVEWADGARGEWVPAFHPQVRLRAAAVVRSNRLSPGRERVVPGLVLMSRDGEIPIGDPAVVQALQQVDGRRTLREILDTVVAATPVADRFVAYASLMSLFTWARRQGIMSAG